MLLGPGSYNANTQKQLSALFTVDCARENFRPSFYTQELLHKETFIHRRFYTQKFLHTELTHRNFYTQKLLHKETFTQRNFYIQKFLHTGASTHRHFLRTDVPFYFNFRRSNLISCEGVVADTSKS